MPDTLQQNAVYPSLLEDSIFREPEMPAATTATAVQPVSARYPIVERNKNEYTAPCLIYSILFLSLFAFLRIRGKELLPTMFQLLVKRKKFEFLQNEGISSNITIYLLALTLSFSAVSIALVYCTHHVFLTDLTLYVFAFLFLYHVATLCIVQLAAWTFNAPHTGEEIVVNIWSFNITTGLVIAPFLIASFFVQAYAVQTLLVIIISCLGILFLVKFFRWLQILFVYRVSIFYMILYLCALEVIPLLVLYRSLVYE